MTWLVVGSAYQLQFGNFGDGAVLKHFAGCAQLFGDGRSGAEHLGQDDGKAAGRESAHDRVEGRAAFAERRTPKYQGR